jgi:two-component system, chemotaxis family, protein-glutamate methylesterase/glutaminase
LHAAGQRDVHVKADRIVVIGGSAGAVEALMRIVRELPPDLNAAVLVVIHIAPDVPSALAKILSRAGPLPAQHAVDGEPIETGRIYIAPPDLHLLVDDHQLRLGRGPRENGHRPAVDPLFRSAAEAYGWDVMGIIVSGNLSDGASGATVLRSRGGTVIIQDPEEALYPGMPQAAAYAMGQTTRFASLDRIPGLITSWVMEDHMSKDLSATPTDDSGEVGAMLAVDDPAAGAPSSFICPDCGGSLWQNESGNELLRFRCRVGHAFTPESLFAGQLNTLDHALWAALRALEETAAQAKRMAERMRSRGQDRLARRFELRARDAEGRADIIRTAVLDLQPVHIDTAPLEEAV